MNKTKYINSIKDDLETILEIVDTNEFKCKQNLLYSYLIGCNKRINNIENNTFKECENYLRNFECYFHIESSILFLKENNIYDILENIVINMLYYTGVLRDYSTLSPSISEELNILLTDTPDIVKANCIYSLLLQYYTMWTNKLDEKGINKIMEAIKEECTISPDQFFENVKFLLETYKPVYNMETRNHFVGRDGHGGVSSFPFHHNENKVDIYKLNVNELMCMIYKSVYNEVDILHEFIVFIDDVLINTIIFDEGNLYNLFKLYKYPSQIWDTCENASNEEYIIDITNDGKDMIIRKEEDPISLDHFINTFSASQIKNVYLNVVVVDDYWYHYNIQVKNQQLIKNIYERIFVRFIHHKTMKEVNDANIVLGDIVNFIIKEYI